MKLSQKILILGLALTIALTPVISLAQIEKNDGGGMSQVVGNIVSNVLGNVFPVTQLGNVVKVTSGYYGTDSAECDLLDFVCYVENTIGTIGAVVLFIVSRILWIANEVFNFSVSLSIRDFSTYINQTEGIEEAWKMGRDLTNLFLIFIMLYIAIGTMLELKGVDAKKMITRLIIVALFVNFSAVIPRVVIDISNLLALQFYEQMGDGKTLVGSPDITGALMKRMGYWAEPSGKVTFHENYSSNKEPKLPAPKSSLLAIIAGIFGKIVFILVTAFILAAGAWMFIWRTIVLIGTVILSPLALFFWSLPKTEKYFHMWWDKLINEAFFAPAYLFLMYVVITIAKRSEDLTFTGNTKSGWIPGQTAIIDTDVIQVVINFVILSVMMGSALIVARSMGTRAAGTATDWGKKARGFGMGLVTGTVGAAGVYTLGKKAQEISNKDWVKNLNKTTWGRVANDLVVKRGLDSIAKSKFGSSSSYQSRVDRNADRMSQFKAPKDQVEYIESLGNADDRKAAWNKLSDRQKAEVLEYVDSTAYTGNKGIFFDPKDGFHKAGSETYQKIEDERKKAKSAKAVKEAKEILGSPTSVDDAVTAGKPIDTEINKLGGDRVTSLSGEVLKHPAVAKHLTVSQLAAIMKDSSFDNVRDDIRRVIETEHQNLTGSGSTIPTNLAKSHRWLTNPASAGYNF